MDYQNQADPQRSTARTSNQFGINRIKTVASVIVAGVVLAGAVVGFGYVQSSTASAQATGDVTAVRTFMKSKFDADKKYPTISLSDNAALSASGNKLSLSDGNKVQTDGTDTSWKAALQSRSLKSSGKSSWFCFSSADESVSAAKDNLGDCLSGAVEPSETTSASPSPSDSPSPSVSPTATPTASETATPNPTYSTIPTKTADDLKVVRSGSGFSCYITDTAYCFGKNSRNQLGTGTVGDTLVPMKVAGDKTFKAVSPGSEFACAIESSGEAYCWGMNDYGQLGFLSKTGSVDTPTKVDGVLKFKSIESGSAFACGITTDNKVACWGQGYSPTPTPIPSDESFKAITAGGNYACGINLSDEAYCWGQNSAGQLGNGTNVSSYVPVHVTAGKKFSSLSAGYDYTCGVTGGTATCWGNNYNNQLGGPSVPGDVLVPVKVTGTVSFTSIYAGYLSSCGIDSDGSAYCWGKNYRGQFGSGTPEDSVSPVKVYGKTKFKSLSVSKDHVCGTSTTGEFYCWGQNDSGQIGNGSTSDAVYPVQVKVKS